jgi:hypothetical protein
MRTFSYNDAQWKLIYELYCYGYSTRELGEWLGMTKEAVWYNFRIRGFKASGDYRVPLSHYKDELIRLGKED